MQFHPSFTTRCLAIALMAGGIGTHAMASEHDVSSPDESQESAQEGRQALDDDALQEKYGITPGALKRGEPASKTENSEEGQSQREAVQAQSDADQAQSEADQAQSDADQAQRDAGQAQRDADQAKRDDDQAQREDGPSKDNGQAQRENGQSQDNGQAQSDEGQSQDNGKEAEQDGLEEQVGDSGDAVTDVTEVEAGDEGLDQTEKEMPTN